MTTTLCMRQRETGERLSIALFCTVCYLSLWFIYFFLLFQVRIARFHFLELLVIHIDYSLLLFEAASSPLTKIKV